MVSPPEGPAIPHVGSSRCDCRPSYRLTPIVTVVTLITSRKTAIQATILAIYVCLLVLVLLASLILQEARYRREVPYAHAMVSARKAFTSLAEASWTIVEGDGSEEAFLLHLKDALGFLAEAFMIITGNACRTSVKMVSAQAVGDPQNEDVDIEDYQKLSSASFSRISI